jgi:response regulator RpfG family c-di-GMP phosphodiesterase
VPAEHRLVGTSQREDTVTHKKKILVVDDTPMNVKLLVDLLGFHNYEMVEGVPEIRTVC